MGLYWVRRHGAWTELVMVEATSPDDAQRVAATIPDDLWVESRILTEIRPEDGRFWLAGVSLSDTRTRDPWKGGS